MNYPLFVYGTLRSEGTHHHIVERWVMEKKDATIDGRLYHFGIDGQLGWFPYATRGNGIVYGEIFNLSDPKVINLIDDFEDNGILYERTLYQICPDKEEDCLAWVYFIRKGHEKIGKLVESGDWIQEMRDGYVLPAP